MKPFAIACAFVSVLLIVFFVSRGEETSANRGSPYSQGIGFAEVNAGSPVGVCIHDTALVTEARADIDAWRALVIDPFKQPLSMVMRQTLG